MDTPPNANVHAIVKAQIVFLLSTLTEENFEQNQLQIRTVRFQPNYPVFSVGDESSLADVSLTTPNIAFTAR